MTLGIQYYRDQFGKVGLYFFPHKVFSLQDTVYKYKPSSTASTHKKEKNSQWWKWKGWIYTTHEADSSNLTSAAKQNMILITFL